MKFKIFVYILLLGFLIYGVFIPTDSGFTNGSLIPDSETIAEHSISEDEPEAEPDTEDPEEITEEESEVSDSESSDESDSEAEPEVPAALTEAEQLVYDWSMTRENPESILLTRDQIHTLNDATIENCDSVTDILSLPDSMPTATVLSYIENTYIPELPKYNNGAVITDDELQAAIRNMNANGEVEEMALGIVTSRTNLRLLPTDMAFCTSAEDLYYDQIQITALSCSMPVWILHTSADGDWLYVQSYSARGWVHTKDVAIAPSPDVWTAYAAPEHGVVITDPQLDLKGTVADMGCVFTCLEDTGSSFTIVVPVRAKDGTLTAKEATVSYESAHNGYLDYTWKNFYTQVFKYLDMPYGWGDANGGVDAASLPGYIMRSFGIQLPRDLERQAEFFGSTLSLTEISDSEKPTALSALHLPSLLYYGDKVSIYLGVMDEIHYEFYAPQATETVRYDEFIYWDRLTSAAVIN